MTAHAQRLLSTTPTPARGTRSMLRFLPLVVFVGIAVFLAIGLTHDPREVPSPLIGKPVPAFSLPPVEGRQLGLSSGDLKGNVSLVNVFASWCVACRDEHPVLMQIKREGAVTLHGLNYKDAPADAARWLDERGDPYTRTGADIDGRVAIDWGVYGAPETFLIDSSGKVLFKHIAPITIEIWERDFVPLIRAAKGEGR